jgi:hypothetical protein
VVGLPAVFADVSWCTEAGGELNVSDPPPKCFRPGGDRARASVLLVVIAPPTAGVAPSFWVGVLFLTAVSVRLCTDVHAGVVDPVLPASCPWLGVGMVVDLPSPNAFESGRGGGGSLAQAGVGHALLSSKGALSLLSGSIF